MTNEEAKFILTAYRPNGQDASDQAMKEALEQAARDPELRAWFQKEQQFDVVISEKLNEVAVPAELKTRILAGHRMMGQSNRRPNQLLALFRWAAVIAVFIGIAAFWGGRESGRSPLADYRAGVLAQLAERVGPLDFRSDSLAQVQRWLEGNGGASFVVSSNLASQPTMGCRVLDWNGAQVTLVCFDSGDGRLAHLLVVDRSAVPGLRDRDEPVLSTKDGWTTASWAAGDHVYLLAGKGDRPDLRRFL